MKNVLFIRPRLLGDIILTIPSVQLYHAHFPTDNIFYLVEEQFLEVARLIPGIKQVLTVPHHMRIRDIIRFRRRAQRKGFRTAVDFHSGPKSALLTRLSGATTRIGYRTPNRNWAYTHLVEKGNTGEPLHSVVNQANLLKHLGIEPDIVPEYPQIKVPRAEVHPTVRQLAQGLHPRIVIHVGAKLRIRNWGQEKFLPLIKRLNTSGYQTIIIGHGPEEIKTGALLASQANLINLTGKLSIYDLLFVIDHAGAYVGADSGPLHLASLTRTPIVALYGPNIPAISGPWRKTKATILERDMACRPCAQKKCIYDKILCMQEISVDEVYRAVTRYF